MHVLAEIIAERVASGLRRKSVTSCSRWAEAYRIVGKPFPGPWTFKYHPWQKEMHDSTAPFNVGQKAAQLGYSDTVLNITFFKIDVERIDCLYVLPAVKPDAHDFSAGRFDPALELSPHLTNLFSDVKNVGHKRAGSSNLYIRGSKSRSGLKSIPIGFIVLDEVDEMEEDNIPLALERQSGQVERSGWAISTPTIDGYGINALYKDTTQEHFFFKCPACGRFTELVFPDCLEITAQDLHDPKLKNSFYKCKECKNKLNNDNKWEWLASAKWVPSFSNRDWRGFHVNQLYSSALAGRPEEMAKAYLKANQNPADEQEFYNSKLGLAHTVHQAKLSDEAINQCIGSYTMGPTSSNKLVTMGVDVGKWLHYEICEWTLPLDITSDLHSESMCRVLESNKCQHFSTLDDKMREYRINACVIDANPETRLALEFCNRFHGFIKMCYYARGVNGKNITTTKEDTGEYSIAVNRTSWLDLALNRFRNKKIVIPRDTSIEYKEHMKTLVRVIKKDADGNPVAKYEKGKDDDHFAHARNYCEIALHFAVGLNVSTDITEDLL